MNVLVTGANGYLGGWLVPELVRRGHVVQCEDSHGCALGIETTLQKRAELECPIYRDLPIEPDAVVALGWYVCTKPAGERWQSESLHRLVALSGRFPAATRFVFASSVAVYGHSDGPVDEDAPCRPVCPYGRAKLEAEDAVRQDHPDSHAVFRFGSLAGLGNRERNGRTKTDTCLNAFAVEAATTGVVRVWNPGDRKPVLHVRDAAALIATAVGATEPAGTLNAAVDSLPAADLALTALADLSPLGKIEWDKNLTAPRSCRPNCDRMWAWLDRIDYPFHLSTAAEAAREFRGYRLTPADRNDSARWETRTQGGERPGTP